eukprot:scaffold64937_cov25-Prasinocladus_malaysianus.AAC.1
MDSLDSLVCRWCLRWCRFHGVLWISQPSNGPAPRMGLSRGGRRGPGGVTGGYVPPFVRKGMEQAGRGTGMARNGSGGSGSQQGGGGSQEEGGALSPATLELLAGQRLNLSG